MSEVSKMEIFSPYTRTGCCFPASTPGTDKLLLSMVAIPVDPLLYFNCSIVRKPGDVQVLRSANREKPFLRWQPEVLRILRRFLSTYVYYIIHGPSVLHAGWPLGVHSRPVIVLTLGSKKKAEASHHICKIRTI